MLRHNISYKLLALAIAIVIWAYAGKEQGSDISRKLRHPVPLEVRGLEPGSLVVAKPKTVTVVLEGNRVQIEPMIQELEETDAVTAFVNLHGKTAGRYTAPVKIELPQGYSGLARKRAIPEEVLVTLVKKSQKTMKIDVQFAGTPHADYRLGEPELSPASAKVMGTTGAINAVKKLAVSVDAGKVQPNGIDGDFPILAQDDSGKQAREVELSPERVHVHIRLNTGNAADAEKGSP